MGQPYGLGNTARGDVDSVWLNIIIFWNILYMPVYNGYIKDILWPVYNGYVFSVPLHVSSCLIWVVTYILI